MTLKMLMQYATVSSHREGIVCHVIYQSRLTDLPAFELALVIHASIPTPHVISNMIKSLQPQYVRKPENKTCTFGLCLHFHWLPVKSCL